LFFLNLGLNSAQSLLHYSLIKRANPVEYSVQTQETRLFQAPKTTADVMDITRNSQGKDYNALCESLYDRYCRLLLITGDSPSKNDLLRQIWNDVNNPLHVGKELVMSLCDQVPEQRTKMTVDFFKQKLNKEDRLYLTDIEILFDPSLRINPINLFRDIARNQIVIVNWPGKINFSEKKLTYASPECAEYFSADITDDILFFDESGHNSLNNTTYRS